MEKYYSIQYLDDNDIKHLIKLKDKSDIVYLQSRFTLLEAKEEIGGDYFNEGIV